MSRKKQENSTSSRRNFKIKIPVELLEIVTTLEFLMQKKEMYVFMCQGFNKKLKDHQEKKINIMELITPEYGQGELIVYFPDDLLAPVEAFASSINMNLRDIVANIVRLYLIEVQEKISKADREVLQKIDATRDRVFKLFHSINKND
jgi:hypothetical protein